MTIGNTSSSPPYGFQVQDHLLFSGKSTVSNGDFVFTFIVPKDISLPFGRGKISYYAQDQLTDASGFSSDLVIGGEDPLADSIVDGPSISLFMDTVSFVSGEQTGPDPVLLAFLIDETGINHQDLGIGHDIVAILDNDDAHSFCLNPYYMPATDDYTSGSIRFPFADLSRGIHTIRLKAWNLYDISSEKEISFRITDPKYPSLSGVINYPNPFQNTTSFSFTSNNIPGDLTVRILIYTCTGQPIKTIQKTFPESNTAQQVIDWDGNSDNGQKLPGGIYLYRVLVMGSDGTLVQVSQKLVIL
jgi:hypothetical protein